jgi:chemotaxis protein methyltransferase CheR
MPGELAMSLTISEREFSRFQRFIYETFGIALPEAKREMLGNRLRQMIVDQGFQSFDAYFEDRLTRPTAATLDELINRVSTNHTYFYREAAHFTHLTSKALPEVTAAAKRRAHGKPELRVWCAAASSGQEPYGLAIQLREYFGSEYGQWDAGLLATDISDKALTAARAGVYSDEDVEPIPTQVRSKYFTSLSGRWSVGKELRSDVLFRRLNLMNKRFPFKKPFDVIFCRNVMIYFDLETRKALVERMRECLHPGGYFYVGLAESLGRSAVGMDMIMPGVYRRRG